MPLIVLVNTDLSLPILTLFALHQLVNITSLFYAMIQNLKQSFNSLCRGNPCALPGNTSA